VWSGAHLYDDRSTFDFKAFNVDGSSGLSFILYEDRQRVESGGRGVMLDSSYTVTGKVRNSIGRGAMNMHEFNVIDNGKTALLIASRVKLFDVSNSSAKEEDEVWVMDGGFAEVDVATGKPIFEWWALDHINPQESTVKLFKYNNAEHHAWDFM
jgi:hypothetical protein